MKTLILYNFSLSFALLLFRNTILIIVESYAKTETKDDDENKKDNKKKKDQTKFLHNLNVQFHIIKYFIMLSRVVQSPFLQNKMINISDL